MRYQPGDRVCAELRDTVWVVREFNPQTGFYTVDGDISRDPLHPWPTVRAFSENELWPASIVQQINTSGATPDEN